MIAPTHEIWAVSGSTTLAGLPVTVWGYNNSNTPVTKPGGPTLTATVGEPVALALHNQLGEASSLVIRGQNLPTDQTGAAASGGVKVYTFTPTEPGTYIYEAGPLANAQHQVAMGLYGVLVVNPTSGPPANEAVVLVSDIDNALNNSANPATFDMRNFKPKYTLINGVVYPTANAVLGTVAPGSDILVRYVNAGINYHSMSVLGANQQIVADDGHALAHPYTVVAQTVGPGQTTDAVVHASPTASAGTMLAVFDANLQLRNRNRRPATATAAVTYGGALGFVQISGTPDPADTVGPVASNLIAHDDQHRRHHQRRHDRWQRRAGRRVLDRRRHARCLLGHIRITDGQRQRHVRGALVWQPHDPGARPGLGQQLGPVGLGRRVDRQPGTRGHRAEPDAQPVERVGRRRPPRDGFRRRHRWLRHHVGRVHRRWWR